jgi:hypothetical protein
MRIERVGRWKRAQLPSLFNDLFFYPTAELSKLSILH